jgi:pyruvate,water dikinase
VENRSYDILNSVAALPHKFVVLYPGLSATAHAMRVLSDFGHTAITIGTRLFNDGEEVIIKSKDGHITIDPITKENLKDYVVNLHDALLYSRSVVGGKALNLSILKAKGFNVPHGAVLTTNLTAESNDVLASIWPKIEASMSLKKTLKYAVRSSANVEDGSEYSFAGQFDSFLNVSCKDIKSRVHEVLKSVEKSALKAYMEVLKKPEAIKMAVIVQEMIDADKSGVVFGKDVQTGDDDLIVIDVTKGLASGVVEGTAKTHRVVYSRMKDKIISETNGNDSRLLTRLEVDALVEMVQSIENLMGETQDIEWAIDKKGSIWIIQTRGISV